MTPSDVIKTEINKGITELEIAERVEMSPMTIAKIADNSDRLNVRTLKECMSKLGFELKLEAVKATAN